MQKAYKVEIDVTQQEIDDILDAALQFCGYWCDNIETEQEPEEVANYLSEYITRGGQLLFRISEPYESGGMTAFILTEKDFIKALSKTKDFEYDNYDGPMADAVLQTALFGEVIYG